MACDGYIDIYYRGENNYDNTSESGNYPASGTPLNMSFGSGVPVMGGNSLSFNGSSSRLQIGNTTSVVIKQTDQTVLGYFNVTALTGSSQFLLSEELGGIRGVINIEQSEGQRFRVGINDGSNWHMIYSNDPIVAGTWYHFAWVRDSSSGQKLYINGVEQTTYVSGFGYDPSFTGSYLGPGNAATYLGASAAAGLYFGGLIDEFVMYSRVLDEIEIGEVYASSSPYCDLFLEPRPEPGTFYVNPNGSGIFPYTSPSGGATTIGGLISSIGGLFDGDIIEVMAGGDIFEPGEIIIDVPNVTIRSYGTNGSDRKVSKPNIFITTDLFTVISGADNFKMLDLRIWPDYSHVYYALNASGVSGLEVDGNELSQS